MIYSRHRRKQLFVVMLFLRAAFSAVAQDEQTPKVSDVYALPLAVGGTSMVVENRLPLFIFPLLVTPIQYCKRANEIPEERSSKWWYVAPVLIQHVAMLILPVNSTWVDCYLLSNMFGRIVFSAPGLVAAGIAAGFEYYNDCQAQEAPVQAEEVV